MRATMRIKFSDSAHWGGKSALIGNVSTHLKHAKACPYVLMKSHVRHTPFTPYKVTKKIKTASIILK